MKTFENPIIVYADPASSIEAISIEGNNVTLEYVEYGNVYKTETKLFYQLPETTQKDIRKYLLKN